MTPVERLQAAIDKLERRKAAGTPGQWWVDPHDASCAAIRSDAHLYVTSGANFAEEADLSTEDAELIVTLHRTIDAQLAILRDGIARVHSWTDPDSDVGYEPHLDGPYPPGADATYLALATAILGGEA